MRTRDLLIGAALISSVMPIFMYEIMHKMGVLGPQTPEEMKDYWESFNSELKRPAIYRETPTGTEKIAISSLTETFFDFFKLYQYVNTSCESMVQFGASKGKFLQRYQELGWDVVGFDYSDTAINALKAKNIKAIKTDLSSIDHETKELSYAPELRNHLAHTTNILVFRVAEYLDLEALNLFLNFLIDNATPGSVIFIAGHVDSNNRLKVAIGRTYHYLLSFLRGEETNFVTPRTYNYKLSFFAGREDMEILRNEKANLDDELLVVRKRSV